MFDKPWSTHVLQWGLWLLVMTLVMGWVARARLRARCASAANVLEHPTSTLIIGLVCSGFFLAVAVLSYLFPGKDGSIWISLFFVGFALLGVPLLIEYFRVRHHLEPGGMRYRSFLGKSGTLRWNEVASVRYAPAAKWFRLETRRGEVVRISAMLTGLPEFARAVLLEVPMLSIETETRTLLEQTASGSPPSLWG